MLGAQEMTLALFAISTYWKVMKYTAVPGRIGFGGGFALLVNYSLLVFRRKPRLQEIVWHDDF